MPSRRRGPARLGLLLALVAALGWLVRRFVPRALAERARARRPHRARLNEVDTLRPTRVTKPATVAVIGGGLAGVAAASVLAGRGFQVTLFEAGEALGGQLDASGAGLGGDVETVLSGSFNLERLVVRVGAQAALGEPRSVVIATADGTFDDRLDVLPPYDEATSERLDGLAAADWADRLQLSPAKRRVLDALVRLRLGDPARASAAEVLRTAHAITGPDGRARARLLRVDAFRTAARAHLEGLGVTVRLGAAVDAITRQRNGRLRVAGKPFDDVIVAVDPVAAAALLEASAELVDPAAPALRTELRRLAPGTPWATLHVRLDRPLRPELRGWIAIDGARALHAVGTLGDGALLTLHARGHGLPSGDALQASMLETLRERFPELRQAAVLDARLSVGLASAPDVGDRARRPATATGTPGLWLAGDFVRLDGSCVLAEAAVASGLAAANAVLAREGLRQEPVYGVAHTPALA